MCKNVTLIQYIWLLCRRRWCDCSYLQWHQEKTIQKSIEMRTKNTKRSSQTTTTTTAFRRGRRHKQPNSKMETIRDIDWCDKMRERWRKNESAMLMFTVFGGMVVNLDFVHKRNNKMQNAMRNCIKFHLQSIKFDHSME